MTRSPLRITLGGGGTDLPSYYRHHEGFLIAATINQYVYVNVRKSIRQGYILNYSELEKVKNMADIRHPIIRETLRSLALGKTQLEISILSDMPGRTGLGSSGSFTTALLKSLYAFQNQAIDPQQLAELACHIEIERLGEPIGKQDQYIAAFGGLKCLTFHRDDRVTVAPLILTASTLADLQANLLLFFTGICRESRDLLQTQHQLSLNHDSTMFHHLHEVKAIGYRSQQALLSGNLHQFGELMHESWLLKKQRSIGMTNAQIDEWYSLGLKNGAVGGKLVGAGGGGCLMFYASEREKLRHTLRQAGLEEVSFSFVEEGTQVVTP